MQRHQYISTAPPTMTMYFTYDDENKKDHVYENHSMLL